MRFFGKWPRRWRRPVTLSFGHALPAGTRPDEARLALQETAARAAAARLDPCAATAEAFDGACLVRRDDRLVSSLADTDPLVEPLGSRAGSLLGIHAMQLPPETPPGPLLAGLAEARATIWVARPDQVQAAARAPADTAGPGPRLAAVVMPITALAEIPAAVAARDGFRDRVGVEPVVAFAPQEAGGLVAMRSPPARMPPGYECPPEPASLGRVVAGVAVWPTAAVRERLRMEPPFAPSGADGLASVVVGATLPRPAGPPSR